jgi:HD-GYP domain-containing protein (c-di-GMP phosphodiesterase class II)
MIDLAILAATDLRMALEIVLADVITCLHVDIAAVYLFNPDNLMLSIAAITGNRAEESKHVTFCLDEGFSGNDARISLSIALPDCCKMELLPELRDAAVVEQLQSLYLTPLVAKGDLAGMLSTGFRTRFNADQEWIGFFEALAAETMLAVEGARSFEELQDATIDLKLACEQTNDHHSKAMDLQVDDIEGHTLRVTVMTLKVAASAGMSVAEMAHVRRGCLLHDIGKIGIPDAILLKPGNLTDEEWSIMRMHPVYAHDLLAPLVHLRPAMDIPYCHHERWDGTGYPNGLKGEQIPLAARYFTVVDVWDALRSDRPYRKGWPEEQVLQYISDRSGTHFDPGAVELFFRVVQEEVAAILNSGL